MESSGWGCLLKCAIPVHMHGLQHLVRHVLHLFLLGNGVAKEDLLINLCLCNIAASLNGIIKIVVPTPLFLWDRHKYVDGPFRRSLYIPCAKRFI